MDYRIRRFLISAAVIFIAALLFLWAMHWMGKGINRVNSPPVERGFQGVLTIADKAAQAAPEFTRAALRTVADLEYQIERRPE